MLSNRYRSFNKSTSKLASQEYYEDESGLEGVDIDSPVVAPVRPKSGYYVVNPMGFMDAAMNYAIGTAKPVLGGALVGGALSSALLGPSKLKTGTGAILGAGVGGLFAADNIREVATARDQSRIGRDLKVLKNQLYSAELEMERARRSSELLKLESAYKVQQLKERYPGIYLGEYDM